MTNQRTLDTTTNCHNCVFADFENDPNNKLLQIGCSLGRVEEFTKRGETSLITEDGITAATISRFCLAKRDEVWKESVEEQDKNIKEQVEKEFSIALDFVLIENGSTLSSAMNRLGKSLEYIISGEKSPRTVIITTCNPEVLDNIKHYVDIVQKTLEPHDIKYLVITSVESEIVFERLVDLGVAKSPHQFYSAHPMGEYIPNDFIVRLDYYINHKLNIVMLMTKYGLYNMVVQTKIHSMLRGNDAGYIEDKIESLAEEQDKLHVIHSWEDTNVFF